MLHHQQAIPSFKMSSSFPIHSEERVSLALLLRRQQSRKLSAHFPTDNKVETRQAERRFPGFRYGLKFYKIYLVEIALKHSISSVPFFSTLVFYQFEIFKKSAPFSFTSAAKMVVEFFSTFIFLRIQDAAFGSASHIF